MHCIKMVQKKEIEYREFQIRDKQCRSIDFNGDVLRFTLHLT